MALNIPLSKQSRKLKAKQKLLIPIIRANKLPEIGSVQNFEP